MKYYVILNDIGTIHIYSKNRSDLEDFGKEILEIDYDPIWYKGEGYTREKFAEIEATQEYKDEQAQIKKDSFDYESKQMENEASYIEYQGKKFSLEEILFKSLVYTSVTDLEVYLKSEDGDLVKMSRTKFLLLSAKAKSNLKDTEEALYNAVNNYDPNKTLEESIQALKNVLDSINKIFNS